MRINFMIRKMIIANPTQFIQAENPNSPSEQGSRFLNLINSDRKYFKENRKIKMEQDSTLKLPKGWEIKRLGEVCEIINGSTPLRTHKEYWENGEFPWFTIDDIREQGRKITFTRQKITKVALNKLRTLPIDTVLLCCTASVGEYAITKIELTT